MPLVVYTLLRLGVLVVAFFALWGLRFDPLLAGILAILIASAVSYLFLRKQRDATTAWIAARVERRKAGNARTTRFAQGVAADEAAEDGPTD